MYQDSTLQLTTYPLLSVSVVDLIDELEEMTKWESFALHLPCIKPFIVHSLKQNNPFDVDAQKRALFEKWLEIDPDASWDAVIRALEIVHYNTLAHKLRTSKLVHTEKKR